MFAQICAPLCYIGAMSSKYIWAWLQCCFFWRSLLERARRRPASQPPPRRSLRVACHFRRPLPFRTSTLPGCTSGPCDARSRTSPSPFLRPRPLLPVWPWQDRINWAGHCASRSHGICSDRDGSLPAAQNRTPIALRRSHSRGRCAIRQDCLAISRSPGAGGASLDPRHRRTRHRELRTPFKS